MKKKTEAKLPSDVYFGTTDANRIFIRDGEFTISEDVTEKVLGVVYFHMFNKAYKTGRYGLS